MRAPLRCRITVAVAGHFPGHLSTFAEYHTCRVATGSPIKAKPKQSLGKRLKLIAWIFSAHLSDPEGFLHPRGQDRLEPAVCLPFSSLNPDFLLCDNICFKNTLSAGRSTLTKVTSVALSLGLNAADFQLFIFPTSLSETKHFPPGLGMARNVGLSLN